MAPCSASGDGPGAVQLDAVALAIIETQRLDLASAEPVQRPIQTGGGILPAGQDDQGTGHGNAACPLASRTLGLMAIPPRGSEIAAHFQPFRLQQIEQIAGNAIDTVLAERALAAEAGTGTA